MLRYKYMELITVINFICVIYLLVVVHDLKQKNTKPLPALKESRPKDATRRIETTVEQAPTPETSLDSFMRWFQRDWPLKVGALFVLLGFVWLVSYAFLNNWIGPVGRIVIGLCAGSAMLAWGARRIRGHMYQGEIIAALGASVILVSIFSAQYIYNTMFPPAIALALVVCVAGILAYMSYVNNTVRLAAMGLIVGSLAPVLIGSKTESVLGLFSYLLCLIIGTVWLVRLTGWRILTIASIFIVWIYSMPWLTTYGSPTNLLYMRFFAVTFTVLFYLLSLASLVVDRETKSGDEYIGLLIGLYSFHWISTIMPSHWQSLVFVSLAIGFMAGSLAVFRIHRISRPVYLYTAVSIGFLIAASMTQFQGETLAAVLATEALALMIYADKTFGVSFTKIISALFILPLFLSLGMFFDFKYTPAFQLSLLYIGGTLYAGAYYIMKYRHNKDATFDSLGRVLLIGAGIYSLIYAWVAMPFYLGYRENMYITDGTFTARVITLILYAVVGISLYLQGKSHDMRRTRQFGLGVLLFVTFRLLIFEVWDMTLGPRIITFFAIGAIFIASVFVKTTNHET